MLSMLIRHARVPDAHDICRLVNHYAEQGLMLHRSLESVYDCLREFFVCEDGGKIIGCVAVDIYWSNSAEIRSLAIAPDYRGRGAGKALVRHCIEDSREIGLTQIFAMTYNKEFFASLGFEEVDIKTLPEKIWRECLEWYSKGYRHESAMLYRLTEAADAE